MIQMGDGKSLIHLFTVDSRLSLGRCVLTPQPTQNQIQRWLAVHWSDLLYYITLHYITLYYIILYHIIYKWFNVSKAIINQPYFDGLHHPIKLWFWGWFMALGLPHDTNMYGSNCRWAMSISLRTGLSRLMLYDDNPWECLTKLQSKDQDFAIIPKYIYISQYPNPW